MLDMKLAFVCVGNAGRSQLATAFAEREAVERGLDVTVVTGGVDPNDDLHDEVVEALDEVGIDVGDRRPREITSDDLRDAAYVVTMGCSVEDLLPDGWTGEHRSWELAGDDWREQRDDVRGRVSGLFDEIAAGGSD